MCILRVKTQILSPGPASKKVPISDCRPGFIAFGKPIRSPCRSLGYRDEGATDYSKGHNQAVWLGPKNR